MVDITKHQVYRAKDLAKSLGKLDLDSTASYAQVLSYLNFAAYDCLATRWPAIANQLGISHREMDWEQILFDPEDDDIVEMAIDLTFMRALGADYPFPEKVSDEILQQAMQMLDYKPKGTLSFRDVYKFWWLYNAQRAAIEVIGWLLGAGRSQTRPALALSSETIALARRLMAQPVTASLEWLLGMLVEVYEPFARGKQLPAA